MFTLSGDKPGQEWPGSSWGAQGTGTSPQVPDAGSTTFAMRSGRGIFWILGFSTCIYIFPPISVLREVIGLSFVYG